MLFARIWTTSELYTDYSSIRNLDNDSRSINGVTFWQYEGGGASFELIKDATIESLMLLEPINNVVPVFIQIYRDLNVIACGYPFIDGFELAGQGKDTAGNYIDVIRITINDIMSCVIKSLEKSNLIMTADSDNYVEVNDTLNTIVHTVNMSPKPFLMDVEFNNEWADLDSFPYQFQNMHLYNLDWLDEPAIDYPFSLAPYLVYTKTYIAISQSGTTPEFTAVKWRSYYRPEYWPSNSDYRPAYYETLHYRKGRLQGGNVVWLDEVNADYLHIVDGVNPYTPYVLLISNSLLYDDSTIAVMQDYVSDDQHWWVEEGEVIYTGMGSLTQYSIIQNKYINMVELLGILLNMTFSSLYSSGHGITRKNKTITETDSAVAIQKYAKFKCATAVFDGSYNQDLSWMRDGTAIVEAINDYYQDVIETMRYNMEFETSDDVDLSDVISIREYVAQISEIKPNKNTGILTVSAIGYR